MGTRKYEMHRLATVGNFVMAMAVIVAAVILNSPDTLTVVVTNVLAQGAITGSANWANAQEHKHSEVKGRT